MTTDAAAGQCNRNLREQHWARINREIDACSKCPLYRTAHNKVKYGGSPHATILFVGEAPGYHEDIKGKPFVGSAGRVLDELIRKIGISNYCVVNVVKCRPPDNKMEQQYVESCVHFLYEQIQAVRPLLIVPLGAVATCAVMKKEVMITQVAGKVYEVEDYRVYPMLHPAAVLRTDRYKEQWYDAIAGLQMQTLMLGMRKSVTLF